MTAAKKVPAVEAALPKILLSQRLPGLILAYEHREDVIAALLDALTDNMGNDWIDMALERVEESLLILGSTDGGLDPERAHEISLVSRRVLAIRTVRDVIERSKEGASS